MKKSLLVILWVGSILITVRCLHETQATAVGGGAGAPAVANGDVNGDGARDISDAIHLLSWLFLGGPEPVACAQAQGDLEQRVALLESIVLGSCLNLPDANQDGIPDCAQSDVDADQDGVPRPDDCDDANPSVHPGAQELCDTVDNDCDGQVNEGFDLSADLQNCGACGRRCGPGQACVAGECFPPAADADLDGFSPPLDCDDANAAVHPAASEVCDDGVDNDCDGTIDAADSSCNRPDGTPCDDGSPCTVNDRILGNQCIGEPLQCDDGNPCTRDVCDEATGECRALIDDGATCPGGVCESGQCVQQ